MKLKKLSVQNYKCIEDSNEFDIDQVTCLVGKNEAGKSALLEALYKVNPVESDKGNFDEEEYPRRYVSTYRERKEKSPANVLTTVWKLEESDLQTVRTTFGPKAIKGDVITIKKGYDNKQNWNIDINENHIVEYLLESSPLESEERALLMSMTTIETLVDKLSETTNPSENHKKFLGQLKSLFPNKSANEAIRGILKGRLPTFVYFAEYNKLPGRVSIDELFQRKKNNTLTFGHRIFIALLDLTNSSPEDFNQIGRSEKLIMELEAVSNRLTDEIFQYWSQNEYLDVQFRFDHARQNDPPPFNTGFVFNTRIYNRRHRATVSFEERSSGFVWFFSFLIWFSQVKKNYGENLFILLDEPGLTLHGKAQQDLLRYINEQLRPNYQVIYSAHSPFMIDVPNIFSLRTVEDVVVQEKHDGRTIEKILGTKVGQRILSRDRDTLLPLQGILGFDIAQTMFVGPFVVVVEGPTEAGYINWFCRQLIAKGREGLDIRWAVAPAEGASKVSSFVTLFSGRGLKIAVLMDYHDGQKRMVDELEQSGLLKAGHLLKTTTYAGQSEADIEDILGRRCYIELVNASLKLNDNYLIPINKPSSAPMRVIKEVEGHIKQLPPSFPEFSHYKPVEYLQQLEPSEIDKLPGITEALDRFEKLFRDLNRLIKT